MTFYHRNNIIILILIIINFIISISITITIIISISISISISIIIIIMYLFIDYKVFFYWFIYLMESFKNLPVSSSEITSQMAASFKQQMPKIISL